MLLSGPQESRPRNMMLHSVQALQKGFSEGTPRRCKARLTAKPVRQPIVSQDPAALRLHADSPARTSGQPLCGVANSDGKPHDPLAPRRKDTSTSQRDFSSASVAGPLGLWLCAVATGCRAPDNLRSFWEQSQRRNFTRVTTSPIGTGARPPVKQGPDVPSSRSVGASLPLGPEIFPSATG